MIAGLANNVDFGKRTPALAWMILVLMAQHEDLVITSIGDGLHADHSAHYRGEAVDVRDRDLDTAASRRVRAERLKEAMGPKFLVLLEPDDVPGSTAAPHIHCQLAQGQSYTAGEAAIDIFNHWGGVGAVPAAPAGV